MAPREGRLLGVSDLHVSHGPNRAVAAALAPGHPDDWLLVAGDVAERVEDVAETLARLRERFAAVAWAPGNHELWTVRGGEPQRGQEKYEELVRRLRAVDVLTPEDEFAVWKGEGGPLAVAPLFLGYDYTFLPEGCGTPEEGLAAAHRAGVVCTDEYLLEPDPHPSRADWCRARVAEAESRLEGCDLPLVLVNHYPLVREPTRALRHPEFAQWCGTELTADWHRRFPVAAVVYGHLHIPRTTWHDGVPFQEVSLGYPREHGGRPYAPRELLLGPT
ncbi:metallophosphoesterase family protein [Glycomyces paridis]|uniref:Metallophosphoesterase n=1 Tax=Glycomyces paridis TaxID=2126555 RepID=A0A4S8PFD2_9ACTN|nr:metallophosphoesterase [Glycomyces paridis]THV29143.1 metallophosphoesterase [Glycomyces paridis]